MGCCNCMNQQPEFYPELNLQEDKTTDSVSNGFTSVKSSLQNSLKASCRPSFTNNRSPIPEAALESEAMTVKLPDYNSENSIVSWKNHGSPPPLY